MIEDIYFDFPYFFEIHVQLINNNDFSEEINK